MKTICFDCLAVFDDKTQWRICPHNPLHVDAKAKLCSYHDLFDCNLCEDGGTDKRPLPMLRLTEPDRQQVLGALDSLGVALTGHEHQWTDGERAIYENALRILRVES